jgi:hypothetical protein
MHSENEKCNEIPVGKCHWKRRLEGRRSKWGDNIKSDAGETVFQDVDCI